MLERDFYDTLLKYNWRHCKIIVAVSGGVDSMVLLALMHKAKAYFSHSPQGLAGFDFVAAHCNFQLRGPDSDADAQMVADFCHQNNIPLHNIAFETQKIIEEQGGNVQIVARKLRYDWFETLRNQLGYDCIATAHHRQDSVETLLMNFFTGTGIAGLHGILPEQKRIIRPLLSTSKEALRAFAEEQGIQWREDASNQKTDYLRNKLRLSLIPAIESVFPQAVQHLYQNTLRFGEVEQLYRQSIERYRKKLLEKRGKDLYIPLRKLIHCRPLATITYELLRPYGLSSQQLKEALQLIHSDSGRYINMGQHRLIKNRDFFIITEQAEQNSTHILIEPHTRQVTCAHFHLHISETDSLPRPAHISSNDAYIEKRLLQYPLILRPWKEGDYCYPFGMGMKKKKVKKMLIDLKMPIHEKEKVWVIESNKKIVWLCGIRADERFRVRPQSKEIVHLHIEPLNP